MEVYGILVDHIVWGVIFRGRFVGGGQSNFQQLSSSVAKTSPEEYDSRVFASSHGVSGVGPSTGVYMWCRDWVAFAGYLQGWFLEHEYVDSVVLGNRRSPI